MVLIEYAKGHQNVIADVSSWAGGLNFGPNHHLNQSFLYASSNGPGESVHKRRLA